jgi:hypothetical protein
MMIISSARIDRRIDDNGIHIGFEGLPCHVCGPDEYNHGDCINFLTSVGVAGAHGLPDTDVKIFSTTRMVV